MCFLIGDRQPKGRLFASTSTSGTLESSTPTSTSWLLLIIWWWAIIRFSTEWGGSTWFWMRLRRSRTLTLKGGQRCSRFPLEIVYWWRGRLFKTRWGNYGHCCTLSCRNSSIASSSSKNGFRRTSRRTPRTRNLWTNTKSNDCTLFWNHSCFEDWKRMLNMKSGRNLKFKCSVKWRHGRLHCIRILNRSYR